MLSETSETKFGYYDLNLCEIIIPYSDVVKKSEKLEKFNELVDPQIKETYKLLLLNELK